MARQNDDDDDEEEETSIRAKFSLASQIKKITKSFLS